MIVRNKFAGVNYLDVYQRVGETPLQPPWILGTEGVGLVVESDLPEFRNERVAYIAPGSYAEYTKVPCSRVISIPEDVSYQEALALTIHGTAAHLLTQSVASSLLGPEAWVSVCRQLNLALVGPASWVLVQAASTGVGNLVTQIASNVCGANVVGTSSDWKAARGRETGAKAMLDYRAEPDPARLASRLKELTPEERGFDVVFDGVGKDTHLASLHALRPRGLCVLYGTASGEIPPLDTRLLSRLGSLVFTRPSLDDFLGSSQEMEQRSSDLFRWLREGKIRPNPCVEFALEDAARAHALLEAGGCAGKPVLRL